ncbi:hypothetical protein C2845_PM01G35900 [Panicum miliaceum]|uniref:Uncharacterized protein n=1 Tax=Panicum miliaceum TaxID=4540 RepID=A0A3L6TSC8_PANMI|nr:hypothetical protein C2845_PM01G35900 [Panicum miliaceum]
MKNPRVLHKAQQEARETFQGPKQAELHTTGDQGDAESAPSCSALDPPRVPGAREHPGDRKGWQVLGGSPYIRSSRRGSKAAVSISKALTLSSTSRLGLVGGYALRPKVSQHSAQAVVHRLFPVYPVSWPASGAPARNGGGARHRGSAASNAQAGRRRPQPHKRDAQWRLARGSTVAQAAVRRSGSDARAGRRRAHRR